MMRLLAVLCALVALPLTATAQDTHRDGEGVIHVAPVRVQGRRQQPIAVVVPRRRDVVDARPDNRAKLVRGVVHAVRRAPF